MFFSPEYLVSRPYGVGTVWLAATVGTQNVHRKISRKDIMAVQIPEACQSFIEPDVPLALRFQSNLLCGVARVFGEQCRYMLIDTSQAVNNIRRSHTSAQAQATIDDINLTHGNLRPRPLVLENDPAFDADLVDDIRVLYQDGLNLADDNSAMIGSFLSSYSGNDPLPASSALSSTPRTIHASNEAHQNFAPETPGAVLLDDLGFEFDQYGRMKEASSPQLPPMLPDHLPDAGGDSRARSGERSGRLNSLDFAGITATEHQEARHRTAVGSQDLDTCASVGVQVSNISSRQPGGSQQAGMGHAQPESPQPAGDETVIGNTKKGRGRGLPKGPIIDTTLEIKSKEVTLWTEHYLENMAAALKKARACKVSRLAKQNAHTLIFKWSVFGELKNPFLQGMFSGEAILEAIQKRDGSTEKRKRVTEDQETGGEEGRRVRARSDIYEEDDTFLPRSEDGLGLPESEVGRKGSDVGSEGYHPSSQKSLPWAKGEIPGSRPDSRQLSMGGFPSSSFGGDLQGHSSVRRSRQSSPLAAKAIRRMSILQSPIGERDEDLDIPEIDAAEGLIDMAEQFEPLNLGANSEAETNNSVEKDCLDFFNFLKDEIRKLDSRNADEEIMGHSNLITLEHLLEPGSSKPEVVANAFSHLLLLGTRGLVNLSQEEPYGAIQISIA
ncbi:Rec8 like protein-domain-containing protein [Tuber brumale]|nr:Rec8 like protein-domain-containing protein [Tuber brumale]